MNIIDCSRGAVRAAAALMLGLLLAAGSAEAHKGSDAYLDVQESPTASGAGATRTLRWTISVAIRDLDLVVPVDADADGKVTFGEIKSALPQLMTLFDTVAQLAPTDGPGAAEACRLHWQPAGLERRSDGVYVRAQASSDCPVADPVRLNYTLLQAEDATHRLLVAGRIGGADLLSTMSPQQGSLLIHPGSPAGSGAGAAMHPRPSGGLAALRDYFSLGLHHLLQGYDHLAFLLALVLPLQLSLWPRSGDSAPSAGPVVQKAAFRRTWYTLFRTITAFTIGHSITLMLATFGLTEASPRWVEPVIAVSIAVTAALNLRPVKWVRLDALALVFGLVHGFGFAGLLIEAAAPDGLLPWALAGFNLGVEAGQLIAVAGWVIVSQFIVGHRWYRPVVVRGGSVVLILLACWWFWIRVR